MVYIDYKKYRLMKNSTKLERNSSTKTALHTNAATGIEMVTATCL